MDTTHISPTALANQAASGPSSNLQESSSSSVKNLSCLQCRKRKTRCDKKYPCSPCVIRGDASSCTQVQQTIASITTSSGALTSPTREMAPLLHRSSFSDHHVPGVSASGATAAARTSSSSSSKLDVHDSDFASDRFISLEAERFYRLEARMDRMERYLSTNRLQGNDARLASTTFAGADQQDDFEVSHPGHSKQEVPVGQDIQDLFEDAAMGRKLKLKSLPFGAVDAAMDGEVKDSETDEEHVLDQRSADSPADVAFRFAQFLPPNTDILLDFYFAQVDWTTRVLPPESPTDFLELSQMKPEQLATSSVPSALVCCYFVVIAIALHFSEATLLEKVGISKREASRLADTLCTGSQQLLWSSNFLQSQQLEHLACICLLGVYQHNRKEQSDGQWALLGSAIKVAQNIGLARLDHGGAPHKPSASMRTEARRELGRRIWWNLTWLDWSHSVAHFGVYSVHPLQNRTNLPANVEIHKDSLTLHSPDVYTHSSAITMRMRYVTIYREIVDVSNERPTLSRAQIHRFVSKLNEVHDSTPACLRYAPDRTFEKPDQAMESVMLELMYLNRILRLHRIHQLSGFTDDEWRFARKACLSSASCIIRILSLQDSVIHKFWLSTFYLLGAAMALVMELCCARQQDLDATSIRASLSTAVSLLSKAGPGSEAARNSRRILKELLSAENRIRAAFARLGGLERIAEERLDTSGTKDVFLDVLQKVFSSTSRCKRKRGMDEGSIGAHQAKRRMEAFDSAHHTRESSVSSTAGGNHVRAADGNGHGNGAGGGMGGMEGAYTWLDSDNFSSLASDVVGKPVEALSVGDGTVASNESDWQGEQSLFPSLDGILSGALSIDEWLGSSYPFDHL
ncbi:hypothetical protein PSEUBRA_001139 [Kalmanozyma brasiliensis GHG001]|uniref:Zn(2)-C6 fungal-type domain-containing protein n=1 Tax=Kalmanozyma brasiliensis (strain GHG001) TaxID=1365824 RepID=V5EZ83_KALBG|nr:uncharacterized protein PSEUBRA_001139 [Kalmanozyma brasiliensis GHG001]EST09188.1 hypothetical protein PSEUBRA_001139 [Kalmanozyma brasiliensis GHG001]